MKKRYGLQILLGIEFVIFGWFYYAGTHGISAVYQLKKETQKIEEHIAIVQSEIAEIKQHIQLVQSDDFYKEKHAREQLHMVREDEQVYLI